jgi:CheY-like chemotaxis protein
MSDCQPASPQPLPTILVIEDEMWVREWLSRHLQEKGFNVATACNAAEALQILEEHRQFDLVFCDIVMPGLMNGIGLALWLRSNRPDLPVILTSGYPGQSKAAKVLCGNDLLITKPFDPANVIAKIRTVLNQRRSL